jgi:predicted small lipoprotein YifL
MNLRIVCCTLVLLLTACGQAGPLVLRDKDVANPKPATTKPQVVTPAPDPAAQPAVEEPKKEQK